jgi:hypothetical protein
MDHQTIPYKTKDNTDRLASGCPRIRGILSHRWDHLTPLRFLRRSFPTRLHLGTCLHPLRFGTAYTHVSHSHLPRLWMRATDCLPASGARTVTTAAPSSYSIWLRQVDPIATCATLYLLFTTFR